MKKIQDIFGATFTVALLAVFITGCYQATPATDTNTQAPGTLDTKTQETVTVRNKNYKDGTYTAEGNYMTPGGIETVNISLNISNDMITDASFQGSPKGPTSRKMQSQFMQGFREVVVGKPIDQVALTVVNGSSLTPKGFMDALNKIKEQAAKA